MQNAMNAVQSPICPILHSFIYNLYNLYNLKVTYNQFTKLNKKFDPIDLNSQYICFIIY